MTTTVRLGERNQLGNIRALKKHHVLLVFLFGLLLGHQLCSSNQSILVHTARIRSQMIEIEPTKHDDNMIPSPTGMKQQNRIAYISQGRANAYINLKNRFEQVVDNETSAFFFHSFDENCNGCAFQANTTLAMGRNIGLKEAINSPLWDTFKYVVFFDDDVTLLDLQKARVFYTPSHKKQSGLEKSHPELIDESWKTFHRMLLDEKTNQPLIKPTDQSFDLKRSINATTYQSCVDDNFWAIRKDHVDFLYIPFRRSIAAKTFGSMRKPLLSEWKNAILRVSRWTFDSWWRTHSIGMEHFDPILDKWYPNY
jgi:hypothetical protein